VRQSVVPPYSPGLLGCLTSGHVTPPDYCCIPPCSLDNNALCGVNEYGGGYYTIEGITTLCEGIKQSNIQSLR